MIWQRYFLRETLKIFALILFSFYFLYCAFDYSLHMQDFLKDKKIVLSQFFLYYGHLFIKRADLLIPLALLVAMIKVLSHLNVHREFLAFQVAGLPFRKLMKPFFLIAILCSSFQFATVEYFLPISTTYLDNFHMAHFRHATRGHRKDRLLSKEKLHVVPLQDRSKLIYQYFDPAKEAYFDVIWVRSAEDLWRVKYLRLTPTSPQGEYVDHFKRNTEGFFEKTESFPSYELSLLKWDPNVQNNPATGFESRRASDLWRLSKKSFTTSYERSEILTNFFFKCAMPLLPLLIVIAIAPFCIRYSRTQALFFIYAFGIFGYITFYLVMNASVILGENHVITPFWAIFAPFASCATLFSWKFVRIP